MKNLWMQLETWNDRLHALEKEIESKNTLPDRNDELLAIQRKYIAELEGEIAPMKEKRVSDSIAMAIERL